MSGSADGNEAAAQFDYPAGVSFDGQGNIYVADEGNNYIRKITPAGIVSTLAGSSTAGFADGNGMAAHFHFPTSVACDPQGNIYVADAANQRIRKITPAGIVSTLAGSGAAGFADGNGTAAQFDYPYGIACDGQANIYVGDYGNNRIRKITPSGLVSTLAGTATAGFADGNGTVAQFNAPFGIACDGQGNIYVVDSGNECIRKITPSGLVSTLAGTATAGFADGNGTTAQFNLPEDLACDTQGNIYVVDQGNHRIRKITVE
jgi:sugar lactone lactonase YvrE